MSICCYEGQGQVKLLSDINAESAIVTIDALQLNTI